MQLKYNSPASETALPALDQAYLREIVDHLSFPRAFGSLENARAEKIVAEEFRKLFGRYVVHGKSRNVCSASPENARILIGAHYDSVPNSPGADDNASAVAVMLAVARFVGLRDDIVYVAFNGEECDLDGSREFVGQMGGRLNQLQQVHVLEMVGFRDRRPGSQKNPIPFLQVPTTGDFLGLIANRADLIDRTIVAAGGVEIPVVGLALPEGLSLDAIRQVSPHLLRSDHAGFWEHNVPAIMWTDTSEFRNPNYHQLSDTPDTLDYDFMAQVAALLAAIVKESR